MKGYHRSVVRSLKTVLKAHPVDILHNNHLVYQPVAAAEVCEELNIPYIIYPRGSAIEYTIRHDKRYQELARDPILKADGLIVGNNEVRDRIINLYPEHRDEILSKTEIVGIGVDTSLFSPVEIQQRRQSIEKLYRHAPFNGKSPELSQELYSRLDKGEINAVTDYQHTYQIKQPDSNLIDKLQKIPWESNILVFVGATIVGKGLQTIIVALPFILKKHPDTHLVVVGSGVSRELFEALVYAITRKNETLLEHVHFLGRLDHDILRSVFPCSNVGLFPSIVPEAYANVLFEALSNGVFPMASYFSGLACGIDALVPFLGQELVDMMKISIDDATRIPGLIKGLSRILSGKKIEAVSPKLRKIAVENFDWEIRAQQMVAAYSKFISN
ncbi:MAG: glycosyltransferase family 4 protein [Deltaproteobacteria bacterium]|nr:glycosyltransferase family 4 protein [Deltaproteobacteria bacterium]